MTLHQDNELESDYVCIDCGHEYGSPRGTVSTFHMSKCGKCGKQKSVTHQRAFNYLKK